MSSIIVLDSSDEDETPPKKANLKSIELVIKSPSNSKNNYSQKNLPSGITITPHNNLGQHHGVKTTSPSAMQILYTPPVATNMSHTLNNLINCERNTPTPPQATSNLVIQQRKRKSTTSPPNSVRLVPKSFASLNTSNSMSPAAAATTMAPLPPIMPMITGVHSMAVAGATPPLQLMATPSQILGSMAASLNEQIIINSSLQSTNQQLNTSITANPNSNPNQNNINNNFKIHLPPKPLTPSPVASPSATYPTAASPKPKSSYYTGRSEKLSKRVKPTTILKSTDDAWLQQRPKVVADDLYQGSHIDMTWDVASATPESFKSSSSLQTPMASPSLPKSYKSPEILIQSSVKTSTILDLTGTPEKVLQRTPTEPSLDDSANKNCANTTNEKQVNGVSDNSTNRSKDDQKVKLSPKPPLEPEFEELIKVCKSADPSLDMKKLIKTKLIKYYYEVHGDFVRSKSFRKSIRRVISAISAEPDLVYYNLTTIVEELKVRRKAKVVELQTAKSADKDETDVSSNVAEIEKLNDTSSNEKVNRPTVESGCTSTSSRIQIASTGNKKLDEQIKKLNKALYVLTKRIEVLEQSEVDWDDDDSSFLQVERFKKTRMPDIRKNMRSYRESKNAHRLVKKPIKFNETRIPQFNKTLQAFINRTKEFPDYYDVLRMLEHCNRNYGLGLVSFEIKNIAEDAFIKVGKLLQSRRKADLYETVTHYGGREKDPAFNDPVLAAKLNENQKNCKKISDILEKFARKQDMPDEDDEDDNKADNITQSEQLSESNKGDEASMSSELKKVLEDSGEPGNSIIATSSNLGKEITRKLVDGESDDEEEEDEEDEADLEEHVENLANGEVSDIESENESTKDDTKINLSVDLPDESEKTEGNSSIGTGNKIKITNAPKVNEVFGITHGVTVDGSFSDAIQIEALKNNNNNVDRPENKTAIGDTTLKDCTTPPLNGKLKDIENVNTFTTSIVTTIPLANATADVKIVAVSSQRTGEIMSANISGSSSKLFVERTHKSLEEIVISDEES